MEIKRFYRVGHHSSSHGLWYDSEGNFTGAIHNELNFCLNSELEMPFDEEVSGGWLSAADTMDNLFMWFPLEDITRLHMHGYRVEVYDTDDYKFYKNHFLINEKTSKLMYTIVVGNLKNIYK